MTPSSGSLFPQKFQCREGRNPTLGWMGTGEAAPQFLGATKTHWDGDELKNEKQLGFGMEGRMHLVWTPSVSNSRAR